MKSVITNQNSESQNKHELPNSENLLNAFKALKSKNPLLWEFLPGKPYLSGFLNCPEDKAGELIQSGVITRYEDGGKDYYLISQVVAAINSDPSLQNLNWLSYRDKDHTPDDPIIHWIKWKLEGRILIKFLFRNVTYYTFVKPEMWRRNTKIGNQIIREINKRLKSERNGR